MPRQSDFDSGERTGVLPVPTLRGQETRDPLTIRASLTLIARALAGMSLGLHRIADALEQWEAE